MMSASSAVPSSEDIATKAQNAIGLPDSTARGYLIVDKVTDLPSLDGSNGSPVFGASDSDRASQQHRHSMSGFIFVLNGGAA